MLMSLWRKIMCVGLWVPMLAGGVASAQCDPAWSPGFERPTSLGFGHAIYKAIEFDDGSGPALFGLTDSGRVMRYQSGAWAQAGTVFYANASGGTAGRVLDLIVFQNELFVCGAFQRVGTTGVTGSTGFPSTTARGVAKWSPTTGIGGSFVSAAGTVFQADATNGIAALAVQDFGSGPKLYATGNLGLGNRLAVYNGGTSWTVLPSFADNLTRAMVAHTEAGNPKLVIGGDFGLIGGATAECIVAYNGTGFEPIVPGGFPGGAVYQLAESSEDNNLFIYGGLYNPSIPSGWGVARWDGANLHSMALTSASSLQKVFSVDDGVNPGQTVYFNAGGLGSEVLRRWTGTTDEEVVPGSDILGVALAGFDADGPGGPLPRRLSTQGKYFLVDGEWTEIPLLSQDGKGGVTFDVLIPFDADGTGPEDPVLVGFVLSGSMPATPQGVQIPRVGYYDGGFIRPFGVGLADLTPVESTIAFYTAATYDDGSGPALYLGGIFSALGETPVNHLLKYDGVSWSGVGGGVFNTADADIPARHAVRALQVFNGDLYVGGNFNQVGGSMAADYIARWDGSAWSSVALGLPGPVWALAVHDDGTGAKLYAATQQRPEAPDPSQNAVFRLDGSTWTQLGVSGFVVNAMASYNGDLYITGNFTSVDGVTYNRIARWDGSAWSSLGTGLGTISGLSGTLGGNSLVVGPSIGGMGEALYVGGRFSTANGVTTGGVAKWDGASFSALGDGVFNDGASTVNPTIESLAMYDDGRGLGLYASGGFTRSGSLAMASLGRYGVPTPAWRTPPQDIDAAAGETVVLTVAVEPLVPVVGLQWQRNGSNIVDGGVYSGATTDTLTITGISSAQAGSYRCVMTNSCGTSMSPPALVTVPCPADFNGDTVRDVADLFAYINAWLAKTPNADFNGDTTVDVADLFAYINAWLAGC